MTRRRRITILISLAVTTALSSTVLPLAIPPFGRYPPAQVLEVVLWQAIATVSWPLVIVGVSASALFGSASLSASLLPVLLYPAMLLLIARVLLSKSSRTWELVLLHLLLVVTFVVMWHAVRNGYDFMVG